MRRPAASSYWKSNWWDTCIFELNELGLSIHSFWVGVPLLGSGNKLVGYVYFRIKWARLYTITHSESEWSRRGAISDLTNVRLRIFNSASVNPYSGITTIWQWQWCLNADSGSTNWTPNAACMAEKRTQAGLSEFHYICEPFSRFIVCSLIKAQWTAAMFTSAVECLINWISVVFNNVDLGKTGPANSKVMPK